MKAVIFARVETQEQEAGEHSIDAQLTKLRGYCKTNNIKIIKEIHGKVNLAEIDFSEKTVVLGVDLDFGKDFKYVDYESLEYLPLNQIKEVIYCFVDCLGTINYFPKATLSNINIDLWTL
jgi:hypothetical protein